MEEKNIGTVLREQRIKAGKSVKEVSDHLTSEGFKASEKTIYSWESNNSQPTPGALLSMCKMYGVEDVLSTFGYNGYKEDGGLRLTISEVDLIESYRSLDDYGRKTIDILLERELDRYDQFKQQQAELRNVDLKLLPAQINKPIEDYGENVVMMPTLMQKLCAGTGSVGDDVQLENEPYPAIRVPAGAQYAATVAGDSMEPEYSDGDVVFFNDTNTPKFGDIVVLSINKENYLKKYTERGFEALNPKYDILVPGESDFVVVLGKVLGKL
ncbi:XRE family transcriptional regulator [Eubacterium maltosivorans]|uniref:XRE family transcriptional regulator n=1 Tax=Eubacterium maltosivorans TaxID=2041044 RepID=UPI00189D5660|nr:XRE family transcriptional regulator [Eubacterium maltosivorans]